MIDFHTVYARHAGDLYRFALYLSGNHALAEDLVAEAFVRLWTARGDIRTETVKAYLLAIVRNLFLTSKRRASRQTPWDEQRDLAHADPVERVETPLMMRESLARVREALAGLSEIDRSALLLRAYEDLSYDDIARVLNISVAAARVKVHRARLRIAVHSRLQEVPS